MRFFQRDLSTLLAVFTANGRLAVNVNSPTRAFCALLYMAPRTLALDGDVDVDMYLFDYNIHPFP